MRHPRTHAKPARALSKGRDFFNQRVMFPMRDASPVVLETFRATWQEADMSPEHRWACLGPFNIAGRVTALVVHPRDSGTWFAGSAAGGVWVSHDRGESWSPAWSPFASQNIGALTWSTFTGRLSLIAATGEANMHGDSYPGSGVYLSEDEGLTWRPLFGNPPDTIEEDVKTFPRRIGCLAFGPNDVLAMGSVYLDDSFPAGLYVDDGRGLKPCLFWGRRSYNCHSVVFHPTERGVMYASIEPDGALNGVWRSRDGGASWEHLHQGRGLPSGDQFGRTSLAIAPSDPDVIYALAASRSSHLLGVFRSTNGGDSWRQVLDEAGCPGERQMSYNNAVAVHPRDPGCVVWGGMQLYRTDNGGRVWRQLTAKDRAQPNYVHADHHVVQWAGDDTLISGNDGGVAVSDDGGRTWQDRSRGMVSTMFYDLDVAPSNGRILAGGTQDNGTLITGVGGAAEGDFIRAVPGDGAWTAFDPVDAGTVFASTSPFLIFRHQRGRDWTFESPTGPGGTMERNWTFVTPTDRISSGEQAQRGLTVMAIEPATRTGPKRLWAASARLWCTDSRGRRWRAASQAFDDSPISAIEIASANPRVMFVGTTAGGIFRSGDRGATWSQNLAGIDLPARAITSIKTHPRSAATVVVTVAATGIVGSGVDLATGDSLPYGHVFLSENGGASWLDLDGGGLPNVAYYAAVYETHPPYRLFVAGDVGVAMAGRGYWWNVSGNLPNVVVSDLVYHHEDRTLTAATYGRGIWRLPVGKMRFKRFGRKRAPAEIADAAGLRVDPNAPVPVLLAPAHGAMLTARATPQPGSKRPAGHVRYGGRLTRDMTVSWRPVASGHGYAVRGYQVQVLDESSGETFAFSATEPRLTFDVPRFRAGKWRVWAIFPDGVRSRPSRWRRFTFTR